LDDLGVRRHGDLAARTGRHDARAFDDHDGVGDRRAAGAVNVRGAVNDEGLGGQAERGEGQQQEEE
jgi:hypothetical protein